MYFRNYEFRKRCLDKRLKSPVSEDSSTRNIVNGPKHCWNLNDRKLPYLLITAQVIELEKVSFSDVLNLKPVCYHNGCQSQVSILFLIETI